MCAKRVLIVDDEDDIREIAQLCMEIAGWEVATAASGQEAARSAMDGSFDVILLDVMMPDLDGVQTLELLRSNPRSSGIPVIFLTAKAQVAEQRKLHTLTACGVIAKPFDPLGLADQISEIMAVAT